MQRAHCPKCAGYEDKVMRRAPGEELAPDVVPCEAFAMSDRFREWAVGQMRKELGGQIGAAGLDRMAILKAAKGTGPEVAAHAASSDVPRNLVAESARAAGTAAKSVAEATGAVARKRPAERPPVGFRDVVP